MNIVISTEHNQLFRQLYAAADTAISNRRLRGMELYAFRSLTPEELIKEAAGSPADLWLMFFDSDSRPDWPDVLDRLTSFSSQIMVCIVSSDYSTAARLINSHSVRGVAGYIHPVHDDIERSCLNILTYLNRRVNSTDEFLIVHGNSQEARLPLASIYYIETVKGTHMCSIHCSDGVYSFRSGIKELSEKLSPPFCQIRASTIANLSNVRSFEPSQGILSFTGGISCCCSRSYRHDVSDYFYRHPRHVHTEGVRRWRKGDTDGGKETRMAERRRGWRIGGREIIRQ